MVKISLFTSSFERTQVFAFYLRLAFFLPILLLILALNIFVDPARIYQDHEFESAIAKIVSGGQNAGGLSNQDERLYQKYLIEKLQFSVDTIVLGSSRSMQIGNEVISHGRLLNHGVSGARLEDYLGIFFEYEKRQQLPKVVILGLDPWILNENSNENRWTSIAQETREMLILMGDRESKTALHFPPEWFTNLFSLSYFQNSVDTLISKPKISLPFPTSKKEADFAIRLTDGTWSYDERYRSKSRSAIVDEALKYGNDKEVYLLGNYTHLSNKSQNTLEKFMEYLTKKNIKIVIFLPPYHPDAYRIISTREDTKIILKAEKYFREIGLKYHAPVICSFNPKECNSDQADFYDAMHPKRQSVYRIFMSARQNAEMKSLNF